MDSSVSDEWIINDNNDHLKTEKYAGSRIWAIGHWLVQTYSGEKTQETFCESCSNQRIASINFNIINCEEDVWNRSLLRLADLG